MPGSLMGPESPPGESASTTLPVFTLSHHLETLRLMREDIPVYRTGVAVPGDLLGQPTTFQHDDKSEVLILGEKGLEPESEDIEVFSFIEMQSFHDQLGDLEKHISQRQPRSAESDYLYSQLQKRNQRYVLSRCDEPPDICSVTRERIVDRVMITTCKHEFEEQALWRWIAGSGGGCPLCRGPIGFGSLRWISTDGIIGPVPQYAIARVQQALSVNGRPFHELLALEEILRKKYVGMAGATPTDEARVRLIRSYMFYRDFEVNMLAVDGTFMVLDELLMEQAVKREQEYSRRGKMREGEQKWLDRKLVTALPRKEGLNARWNPTNILQLAVTPSSFSLENPTLPVHCFDARNLAFFGKRNSVECLKWLVSPALYSKDPLNYECVEQFINVEIQENEYALLKRDIKVKVRTDEHGFKTWTLTRTCQIQHQVEEIGISTADPIAKQEIERAQLERAIHLRALWQQLGEDSTPSQPLYNAKDAVFKQKNGYRFRLHMSRRDRKELDGFWMRHKIKVFVAKLDCPPYLERGSLEDFERISYGLNFICVALHVYSSGMFLGPRIVDGVETFPRCAHCGREHWTETCTQISDG